MVDKEIEEGLAEINVDDKQGTIDAIEVKESNNTQEMRMITLKIKRRRKPIDGFIIITNQISYGSNHHQSFKPSRDAIAT